MAPIEIERPDPRWADDFARVASLLRGALGDRALRIDHIGSTAVPDLPAKPIIDVQVTVRSFDGLQRPLEAAGFRWREIRTDHPPAGRDLNRTELEKRFVQHATSPSANVHLRLEGRYNQRYALLCRDYLRTHPAAAQAYASAKLGLARIVEDDVAAYYAVKDPIFDLIVAAAEDWAAASAWDVGDPTAEG